MTDYGPQALTNTTINSHSSTMQMGVSHARCCQLVLTRCSVVTLCSLLSVVYLVHVWAGCLLKGKKLTTVYLRTYQVQNKASRTETREIVLSIPAGKKL